MKPALALLLTLIIGAALLWALASPGSEVPAQAVLGRHESTQGSGDEGPTVSGPLAGPAEAQATARTELSGSPVPEQAATDRDALVPVAIKVISVERVGGYLGPPLAGAAVGLFHRDSPDVVIGSARTDAMGMATVDAPKGLLIPDEKNFTRVAVRVLDPGYVPSSRLVRLQGEGEEASYRVKLSSVRGWTQPVEVIGAIDASVERPVQVMKYWAPRVRIESLGKPTPVLLRDLRCSVRKVGYGQFEVQVASGTEPRWIVVDGGSGGTASTELMDRRDVNAEVEPIRLELKGKAQLKGVVLDAADEPIVPIQLAATLQPSGRSASFDGDEEPLRSELQESGEGQFKAAATTAADGSFSFRGLMPGRYEFTTEVLGRSGEYHGDRESKRVTLGFAEAAPNPAPIVLHHARPIILVKMLEAQAGPPVGLTLYEAGKIGESPWVKPKSHGWDRPSARYMESIRGPFDSAADGSRTAHFDVAAGEQYLLVANWADFSRNVQLIEVPVLAPKATATVRGSDQSVGSLQVQATLAAIDPSQLERLRTPPGSHPAEDEPTEGHLQLDASLSVTLEDPATGLPLQYEVWDFARSGERGFTCPEGPVRVVATGLAHIESHHGTLVTPRMHGRVEKIVEVKAGATSKVELEVPIGGVLHVEVAGALSELDITQRDDDVARRQGLGDYVSPEEVERMLHAQLFIEDPIHHIYEAVAREAFTNRNSSAAGVHLINEWPLGETHSSTVLPPGSYTLRASFPDRLPIATPVTIREGEITALRLDFGR